MVGLLAGLGAMGPGIVSGAQKGMELYDQYADFQSSALASQLFPELMQMQGMGNLTQAVSGPPPVQPTPPPPITPPGAPQGPGGPTQMAQVGGMVGAPGEQIMPPGPDPMTAARADLAARMRAAGMAGPAYQPPQVAPQGPMPGATPPRPAGFQPPQQTAQADVDPEVVENARTSRGTPEQIMRMMAGGPGWMSPQQLAARIEMANPNASPLVKFKAMQKAMQMMNQGGQTQFNQMMQMLQMEQRERFHSETMREKTLSDIRQEKRIGLAEERQDPIYQRYKKTTTDLDFKDGQAGAFLKSMEKHMDLLISLAEKTGVTGQMDIDGWINAVKARFGSEVANQYRFQLAEAQTELGRLLSGGMGNAALTEGVRGHARELLPEGKVVPAKVLRSLKTQMEANAKSRRQAYQEEIKARDQAYQDYKRTGTYKYSESELSGETPAPAAGGGANDPFGVR